MKFGFLLARFSSDRGAREIHAGNIQLAPAIEAGLRTGGYKAPDTFSHWEMEITVPWFRAPFLWRLARKTTAVQFWTVDQDGGYIEWLFPYCKLERKGWRRFVGVTTEGPGMTLDSIPDGSPITQGGFWKVPSLP